MHRHWVTAALALTAALVVGCPEDGDDDDSSTGPAFAITDVQIDDHPNSVLSCIVRWTTDVPATTRVEWGSGNDPRYFLEDTELVTDHEIVIIGMRPETEHPLHLVSVDTDGNEVRDSSHGYTTAELPFPSVHTDVPTVDAALMEPGWTLANLVVAYSITRTVAVMYDAHGHIVWYYDMGEEAGTADVEITLTDDDTVVIGGAIPPETTPLEVDLYGNVLWEGPLQPAGIAQVGSQHHAFKKLSNGNYVTIFHDHEEGNAWVHDRVDEFTPDLDTVWSWSALDIPDHGEDYLQGNMIEIDEAEDVLYYNSRWDSMLYKVDRATGDVLWQFGEDGDFTMTTAHDHPWFGRAHAPEILPDGHVLYYDNGPSDRDFSRVVEYALDTDAMTASLVWEYDGSADGNPWVTNALGDVDRLPNGNTLVCAGTMMAADSQSRIFEVTADGQLVWEVYLRSAESEDELAGCYMVQRIDVPVGVLG